MPYVSVLMPVYNAEKYLNQSIRSVIAQTFTDWELIIVDDCSTDTSFSIAKKQVRLMKELRYINYMLILALHKSQEIMRKV